MITANIQRSERNETKLFSMTASRGENAVICRGLRAMALNTVLSRSVCLGPYSSIYIIFFLILEHFNLYKNRLET